MDFLPEIAAQFPAYIIKSGICRPEMAPRAISGMNATRNPGSQLQNPEQVLSFFQHKRPCNVVANKNYYNYKYVLTYGGLHEICSLVCSFDLRGLDDSCRP